MLINNYEPKVIVDYERIAYVEEITNVRITFDTNIRYSFSNFDFNSNDNTLFMEGDYIMEIKTFKGIPLWLNTILNKIGIKPCSYSKVGKIYEKMLGDGLNV